jgi:PTH1 family peptidyl-tRNA hydrolase
MLIFAGLGNPGEKYARQRHNVGFMAVDAIAERFGFGPERSRFQALAREGFIEAGGVRHKVLILKPQTFMNDSGQSVGEAARFFKLDEEDVVVFYDELDLTRGKIRVRTGGGTAGHNGIRSIKSHLGEDFRRVRIGIGHPGQKSRVQGHVLSDFSRADREQWLDELLDAIARSAPYLTIGEDAAFMSEVARLAPPPEPPKKAPPVKPAADENESDA